MHLFFMAHSFSHLFYDDSYLPSFQNFTISEQFFPQRQTPNAQESAFPVLSVPVQPLPAFSAPLLRPPAQGAVGVQGDRNVRMAHQILQRLRIHSSLRHVAAVGVAANVRRNVRHVNEL